MLERVAASAVDEIVVVEGAYELEGTVPAAGVRLVRCPEWERGPEPRSAAASPLDDDVEAAVVIMADGPDLSPAAVARVVENWRDSGGSIVAASYGGDRGHPAARGTGGVAGRPGRRASRRLAPSGSVRRPRRAGRRRHARGASRATSLPTSPRSSIAPWAVSRQAGGLRS